MVTPPRCVTPTLRGLITTATTRRVLPRTAITIPHRATAVTRLTIRVHRLAQARHSAQAAVAEVEAVAMEALRALHVAAAHEADER